MSITVLTQVMVVSQGLSSQGPLEQTPPSVLAALAHGFEQRDVESSKPTHKIRVDFKVGHFLQCITYIVIKTHFIYDVVQWIGIEFLSGGIHSRNKHSCVVEVKYFNMFEIFVFFEYYLFYRKCIDLRLLQVKRIKLKLLQLTSTRNIIIFVH